MKAKNSSFSIDLQGKIRGVAASSANISNCDGVQGVFSDGEITYEISNEIIDSERKHFVVE